jgi:hypothetical protein
MNLDRPDIAMNVPPDAGQRGVREGRDQLIGEPSASPHTRYTGVVKVPRPVGDIEKVPQLHPAHQLPGSAVSGLPQVEDRRFVVAELERCLS